MNRNKCPQFVLNFFRDEKIRSHFGRTWNYARTKVQSMLREFGTFFTIVHPVLFWCTFAHVFSYERIFVLRMHIIRLGAESTATIRKKWEYWGKITDIPTVIINIGSMLRKWENRKFLWYPRDIVITIHKYSDIFGDQYMDAFSRGVFDET